MTDQYGQPNQFGQPNQYGQYSQYGQQPPQQPNRPPSGPPPGYLAMNFRYLGWFWQMGMSPLLWIDDWPVPALFGEQVIPIAPGRHRIKAKSQYLFAFGLAEQEIDVAPGQRVELHYSQPMFTFLKGRMGATQQKMPAIGCLLGGLIVLGLLAVLAIALAIISALG